MTREAITASKSGNNIYVEGRTVRGGLNGKQRGTIADTIAVFALTVDSDADKGAAWTPTVPISLSVETSPGNAHHWLFLDKAIRPQTAQRLGERLKAAVGGDADTGVITQPYRLAGTVNYPSKKKRERGRTIAATRILEFNPETLWTLRHLAQTFPRLRKPAGGEKPGGGPDPDETMIAAETMDAIRSPVKGGRGTTLWNVVQTLKEDGWTVAAIVAVLERYPDGLAQKFRGRLRREVERAWQKIDDEPDKPPRPSGLQYIQANILKTMTFDPIKTVVPDILIEGLTLLAGKPKGGKSWLLLHIALAVANNGWTLGELHCMQGDVLYCALEDSNRRLQSRMRKLGLDFPERLCLAIDMLRLAAGGLEQIVGWLEAHPQARLIIIDTLAMIRGERRREQTTYDADYEAVLALRKLANERKIAIVVVHHLRKADADDAFDTVSGTLGLTGAPDSILILRRDGHGGYCLAGRGRDLIEFEKAMTFDRESCCWRIAGEANEVKRSSERNAVLTAINETSEPIGPNDIAAEAEMKATNVRKLLAKLVKEGVVEKVAYGRYSAAKPATANHGRE
jgi:hypothetical protein